MTGRYVPQHGVVDNCIFEHHTSLDTGMATIGTTLRSAGYPSELVNLAHDPGWREQLRERFAQLKAWEATELE